MPKQSISSLIDEIVEVDEEAITDAGISDGKEPMAYTPLSVTKATVYVHC